MSIDLDAIEAAARAATGEHGWPEWEWFFSGGECETQAEARHIATMDPQTTLELVERVRELEERMQCVLGVASQCEAIQMDEIANRIRDAAEGLPT